MKDSEKMVQACESRLRRDIGDRERGRFQELLGMVRSYPHDFVQHGALEFRAKRAF
jgi:hypothetical protein